MAYYGIGFDGDLEVRASKTVKRVLWIGGTATFMYLAVHGVTTETCTDAHEGQPQVCVTTTYKLDVSSQATYIIRYPEGGPRA